MKDELTPKDLECLFDEAAHLEIEGILDSIQAEEIRWRIDKIAKRTPHHAAYLQLLADPDRRVVDLSSNPRKQQWVEDAYDDLKKAGVFPEEMWRTIQDRIFPREHPNVDPRIPLSDLDFSVRTSNCLDEAGIATINELLKRTGGELREIRNFGPTCLHEVTTKLWNRFQVKLPF